MRIGFSSGAVKVQHLLLGWALGQQSPRGPHEEKEECEASGRAGHCQLPCECHDRMCVRYVGKAQGSEQSGENCFGEFLIDRSANPMRCTNNRLACSHRMAPCAQYRQIGLPMKNWHFLAYRCQNQVMQRKCVMKDRREESMLSNRLQTPTLARRTEPLGTMALP